MAYSTLRCAQLDGQRSLRRCNLRGLDKCDCMHALLILQVMVTIPSKGDLGLVPVAFLRLFQEGSSA